MSLILAKLKKVVTLEGGLQRAQCPACAEAGQDKTGNHLRIYPDGKFGCCVYPGDREHRKRIYALTGDRKPLGIRVKVAARKDGAVQTGILGRINQALASLAVRDARDGVTNIQNEECKMKHGSKTGTGDLFDKSGTLGTPFSYPCVYIEKNPKHIYTYKDFCKGVPSVPGGNVEMDSQRGVPSVPEAKAGRLPYLTPDGTLVIPFDCPERYHWWKSGQSVVETIAELLATGKYNEIDRVKLKENYGYGI
ncbi:MAG: hypothetical protein WCO56_24925 [Verrucomicrobiota bacterium]